MGKTTAIQAFTESINPLTYHVMYQSDNHFRPFDVYCQLAGSLGLERQHRYSRLWCAIKQEILHLHDDKGMLLIWILDEAQYLSSDFLINLSSFLNVHFDTREVMVILLVGHPALHKILKRTHFSALTSRLKFHFHWEAMEDFEPFK